LKAWNVFAGQKASKSNPRRLGKVKDVVLKPQVVEQWGAVGRTTKVDM